MIHFHWNTSAYSTVTGHGFLILFNPCLVYPSSIPRQHVTYSYFTWRRVLCLGKCVCFFEKNVTQFIEALCRTMKVCQYFRRKYWLCTSEQHKIVSNTSLQIPVVKLCVVLGLTNEKTTHPWFPWEFDGRKAIFGFTFPCCLTNPHHVIQCNRSYI